MTGELEPNLTDIRREWNCGRTCRGCDLLFECDYCGDRFCASYPYEDEHGRDKNADIMCPICFGVNKEVLK